MNGLNLRKARKRKALSQEALAREVGISPSHLSQCETGKSDFSANVLARVCAALDIRADYLIDPCQEGPCEDPPEKKDAAPEICFSACDFGDRLRSARLASGLTQYDVAGRLGATQANYSKYENGQITPRADSLMRIAQAAGTSVPYLLGLSDEPAQATLTDEESRLVADYREMRPDLKGVLSKTAAAFARPAEGAGG